MNEEVIKYFEKYFLDDLTAFYRTDSKYHNGIESEENLKDFIEFAKNRKHD